MRTTFMQTKEQVERKSYLVDATDLVLGRMATDVAVVLKGKHKPTYTPHIDGGDYVIIVNAEKVVLTGDKLNKKLYIHHTGYNSGLRQRTAARMLELQPQKVVEAAVKGMLPKNTLGANMYRKLFVYCGPEHKQQAQKPEVYTLRG
jgi:large subunit ribosomal protein L13